MANRTTRIYGDQIDDSVVGLALTKNTTDDFSHKLDVNVDDSTVEIATNALQVKDGGITTAKIQDSAVTTIKIADDAVDKDKINADVAGLGLGQNIDGSLEVNVDDSTIEISADTLQVKDGGITTAKLADESVTEAKLDAFNAPTDGYHLVWTTANGLEWEAVSTAGVPLAKFVFHEIPTGLIDSSNTTYTLANTPEAGTVQVYLNGLLQAPGSGLDYTISGSTVTFTKAPRTGSDLYVHYISA